ncbi:hypothetical protein MCHI_001789 [Candidatus Magnetoovum chiemensis]|nr:hypothetical protein MCHI_001789 [Candidatus Magnetoovum chiemensis]
MPKAIKRKIVRKTKPEQEIKNTYEKLKEYTEVNKKNVITISIIVGAILIITIGIWGYSGLESRTAVSYNYEGYNSFYNRLSAEPKPQQENYKTALEKFKKSYDAEKSAATLFYIANTYYKLNDTENAKQTLIELNNEYKGNTDIVPLSSFKLFEIYKAQGDEEKAIETLIFLYNSKSPLLKDTALYNWANILDKKGQKNDAKKKYEELIDKYPESPYLADAKDMLDKIINPNKSKENAQKTPDSQDETNSQDKIDLEDGADDKKAEDKKEDETTNTPAPEENTPKQ